MKMRDRLVGLIERQNEDITEIDKAIDQRGREIDDLRRRRLEIEEEAVETRLILQHLDTTGLRVSRREDGMLVAEVDPVAEPE